MNGAPKAPPPPDPRPGEDGFEGFKMQLPENCVEYMLFLIDGSGESRERLQSLETLRKVAVQLCHDLAQDYIWQRDTFDLEVKIQGELVYLHGTTGFGDCVEDEWLVVYLLRELTKAFPNLWVRVGDNDGEFLLIEAANVLPGWLNPEIDGNRVWIHDSKLHLVPLDTNAGVGPGPLSLEQAVSFLKSTPAALIHSPFIEAEAFYRLQKYPAQITLSLHHALATIPRKLAHVLHSRPKAIAPATELFYLRSPTSVKPLLSPLASLVFPPTDLVTVSVKFTKVLYAQLVSQQFKPLPVWKGLLAEAELAVLGDDEHARKRCAQLELGMKVTAGFEMLVKNTQHDGSRIVREITIILRDLEEDGTRALPTNEGIRAWPGADREDSDAWMNIDYREFEHELEGRPEARGVAGAADGGFGDINTKTDLRKIVSRFEAFLNDDVAGIDGAEIDGMDEDNDSNDTESEDEDKEVSFDEQQFASLMREAMGFPSDANALGEGSKKDASETPGNEPGEADEIRELTVLMESELIKHGALDLDSIPKQPKACKKEVHSSTASSFYGTSDPGGGYAVDRVDIDYNLAKNLLESFKSQAGVAGPTGNLLGLMGISLPRDEGDSEDGQEK